MPEIITLTNPIPPEPNLINLRVNLLILDWDNKHIAIHLKGNTGEEVQFGITGNEATSLMVSLNKANLSVKSLHKRVIEYLVTTGKLVGVISGVPD